MILLGHRKMYKIPFLHPPSFSRQGKYKETRVPLYPQLMPSMGPGLVTCTHRPACVIKVLDAADERWGEGSSRIQHFNSCLFSQLGFFFSLSKGYPLKRWTQWVRSKKKILVWLPYPLCIFFPVKSVIPNSCSSFSCATHDSLPSISVCRLYPYHPYKDLWSPSWYHCLQIQ